MSSEAITQNDLREILSRTVGSIPSEYRKLLWTNPSPSSAFGAQTVSLDLSNYDEVEIEFLHANASDSYLYQKARVGSTDVGLFYTSAKNGIPIEVEGRPITVSNTGIVFSDGARAYNSLTASTDNIRCVPTKIYGIKYERVAPPQVDASDYVIEQGTSGIWTYRKWDSGIAECWGRWISSQAMTSQEGSAYYSALSGASFPTGLFVSDIPTVSFGTANGGALGNYSLNSINTTSFNGYWYMSMSGTRTCTANIHAMGRWK